MKYSYYPGCSLHGTALDYQMSIDAICKALDIELEEVDDWNCCGATAAASEDQKMAMLLAARNITKCSKEKHLAVSCNSCYLRLSQVGKKMNKYPEIQQELEAALKGLEFREKVRQIQVKHILQIFYEEVGLDKLSSFVVTPLKGLKVVPYYGCQLVRPGGFDDKEMPTSLDRLLEALGAEVLPFYRKTKCCGGALIATNEDLALGMIHEILSEADERGAQSIVVTCPLCQINLDSYQGRVNKKFGASYKMPVIYFTQLMGLAFGIDKRRLGLDRGFVSEKKLLKGYA